MNRGPHSTLDARVAIRIHIKGTVQGVGLRPFVYRLATSLKLAGFVANRSDGVIIEVEGPPPSVADFVARLKEEKPPSARFDAVDIHEAPTQNLSLFEIKDSPSEGLRTVTVAPDLAFCEACRSEIFDPSNRRYLYPFTNCTQCGPRFSIVTSLPYDRPNTSMAGFSMCRECRAEYDNPADRRFHAQPNACPVCGPTVALWSRAGEVLAGEKESIPQAARALKDGRIVAVKGVGGFHLMADAASDEALRVLRERKNRPDKPLAVMFPDLASLKRSCDVSETEENLLVSPQSPVVVLHRKNSDPSDSQRLSELIAPGNNTIGAMLPYSPLHAILLKEFGSALVATSGNLSEDPICIDEREALERLGAVADLFLVHNRPIARSVDDSVFHVLDKDAIPLRLSRGFAPATFETEARLASGLSVGGHLKNTVAVIAHGKIVVSQHIGDLDTVESLRAFEAAQASLLALYDVSPEFIVCDRHPDYASSKWVAERLSAPLRETKFRMLNVQHHHAHVASVMAEHRLTGRILGIAWDGSGYGLDGTVWGGEFLLTDEKSFQRVGTLRSFVLPGGEAAVREPRRIALSLLNQIYGKETADFDFLPTFHGWDALDRERLGVVIQNKINCPITTSAGRLFDAAASLMGFSQAVTFEGQAAVQLEQAADPHCQDAYPFPLESHTMGPPAHVLNWEPLIRSIVEDQRRGVDRSLQAAKFHNALVDGMAAMARVSGEKRVALSGGCFQNRRLLKSAVDRIRDMGLDVYWNRAVPANDGGLSIGQAYLAAHLVKGDV